jgi:hypothetical protein
MRCVIWATLKRSVPTGPRVRATGRFVSLRGISQIIAALSQCDFILRLFEFAVRRLLKQ